MQGRTRGSQPVLANDLAERFAHKALALASSVERVAAAQVLPAAVARYLAEHGLPPQAVATGDVAGFDWPGAGLDVSGRVAVDANKVGISGCFCAIAETGTLLLLSGPQTPASVSLLPETHIFISGPSRTGDIEQTIVLGAHGPCRVHLLIIETP
ncbi:MAG: LUD domain-containing protein [Candidatus Dechloromonas phosphoritropha]|jgi:L-lactate dehydrogenase complex protein LldG